MSDPNKFKIKIFCKSGSSTDLSDNIRCALKSRKINFSEVFPLRKGNYIVNVNTDTDIDKLFEINTLNEFAKFQCEPIMSRKLLAERTIILKYCDDSVYCQTEDDIVSELHNNNRNLTITNIFKFPSTKTIKLVLKTKRMADQTITSGLRLFYISHPPHKIEREHYIDVLMCYRCYKLDQHSTRECDKPQTYKIAPIV